MIERKNMFLPDNAVVTFDGIQIMVSDRIGERPATVKISREESVMEIEHFADRCFDSKAGALVPECEVVKWGDLQLIAGLPAVIVAGRHGLLKCELFRTPSEDRGFYQVQWTEGEDRLLCIYESGLIAFDPVGSIVWHRHKHWDDTFVGLEGTSINLLTAEGTTLALDLGSGDEKQ